MTLCLGNIAIRLDSFLITSRNKISVCVCVSHMQPGSNRMAEEKVNLMQFDAIFDFNINKL